MGSRKGHLASTKGQGEGMLFGYMCTLIHCLNIVVLGREGLYQGRNIKKKKYHNPLEKENGSEMVGLEPPTFPYSLQTQNKKLRQL